MTENETDTTRTVEIDRTVADGQDLGMVAYEDIGDAILELVGASDTVGRYAAPVEVKGTITVELAEEPENE